MLSEKEIITRSFEISDAEKVCMMIHKTLIEVNSKDYDKSIIDSLLQYFTPQTFIKNASERKVIVVLKNGSIVGTGAYAQKELFNIFVDPGEQNTGLGVHIVRILEDIARTDDAAMIMLASSITAVGFYKRLGYQEQERDVHHSFGQRVLMKKTIV